jgi:tetraacyldisaccharide 4'-kinase
VKQQRFKQIVSGEQTGPVAGLARVLLHGAALGYQGAVGLRNRLYGKGLLKRTTVAAKVISVGNITAGGTGKTPLVVWLCRQLGQIQHAQTPSHNIAILTRGYKAHTRNGDGKTPENIGDEPALLARSCPEVPVVVNPDRIAGAREAINECRAEVLILDDGFQHRRLHRDLDIVTIDATCPFGYDYLIPAGLLREPVESLRRAQAAVVTRCDQVSSVAREEILKTLHRIHPTLVIAQTRHAPTAVQGDGLKTFPAEQLKGRRIFAFSGLGNPEGFYQTLRVLGAQLVGTLSFDDHHRCTARELRGVVEQGQRTRADLILTTEKNWIGLPKLPGPLDIPLAYLGIELAFIAGERALVELIEQTLADSLPDQNAPDPDHKKAPS